VDAAVAVCRDPAPLELQASMEKTAHQDPTVDLAAMDHPERHHNKHVHLKHAKLVRTHRPDPQETPARAAQLEAPAHPDPHPMAEAVEHPAHQARKVPQDNPAHPETRVNPVFPAKSPNNPAKLVHQDPAVNLVHPETTAAMVLLVSQVAMVLQDRPATAVVQVATAKTAHPVDKDHRASAVHPVRATTAHHHAQHPDTNKPSVYVSKQHCRSHRRCQRIVDIAMVGCWDDIMLSQPPLLYYFRFAFLLLTVLAISTSSRNHLE